MVLSPTLKGDTQSVRALLLILLLAFGLRVGYALVSPSLDWPDEIFQTREPAHLLAFGNGVQTWEWRDGIRSWVLPGVLAGVMRATAWLGPGSYGYLTAVTILLALLSLTTVWFAWAWAWRCAGRRAAVISALAAAVWFHLIYFGPRALNEAIAAHLLLPGMFFAAFPDTRPRRRTMLAGALLATAVLLRLQLGPAVALLAIVCYARRWREWLWLAVGIAVPLAVFGVVDAATWGYPFASYVRYVVINLVQNKSAQFGTDPWWWYAKQLGLYSAPLIALGIVGLWLRGPRTKGWTSRGALLPLIVVVAIVATHSVVAHKELRFIYPAMPLLVAAAGLGVAKIDERLRRCTSLPLLTFRQSVSRGWITVPLALAFCATSYALGRTWDMWDHDRGIFENVRWLSTQRDVCGVAIEEPWGQNGGYTYLHQHVPIYPIDEYAELPNDPVPPTSAYNYFVGDDDTESPEHFTQVRCRHEICVWHRAGGCTPDPRHEFNHLLVAIGQ